MKGLRAGLRRHGLPLLALALLCIPALQPLLGGDFTCGYDTTFHLWRAVQRQVERGDAVSDVEAKVDDVAVLNDVVSPFQP